MVGWNWKFWCVVYFLLFGIVGKNFGYVIKLNCIISWLYYIGYVFIVIEVFFDVFDLLFFIIINKDFFIGSRVDDLNMVIVSL